MTQSHPSTDRNAKPSRSHRKHCPWRRWNWSYIFKNTLLFVPPSVFNVLPGVLNTSGVHFIWVLQIFTWKLSHFYCVFWENKVKRDLKNDEGNWAIIPVNIKYVLMALWLGSFQVQFILNSHEQNTRYRLPCLWNNKYLEKICIFPKSRLEF